jgi:HK97 gp10 family phage protein
MISVTITGGSRIKAALGHGAVAVAAARRELYAGANDIFNESQRRTPVRTGALRGSGTLTQAGTSAEIKYGGTAAGYALYVHEGTSRMAARKFLEGPMAEMGESVLARIKSAVEAAL